MSAVAAPVGRPIVETVTDSHKWWVLGVVVMGTFMSILDSTVVNIALPKLISVFSTDVHGAQWVLTSYLLALAVVIPMTGYLQETYGGKRVYITTITLFTLASMLCGIAWNLNSMIFFRILQGLGGGLIMPLGMSLLLREFRPEERGTALGIFGIPLMMGPAIGPTLGGYLVQYVDWRFIFYINVPIGIFAVIAATRVLRESIGNSRQKLDVLGVALVGIGSALLLLGVDNGPSDGWGSTTVLLEILIGAACLVGFIVVELTVDQPLLDLRLFRSLTFTVALSVTLVVQVGLFGALLAFSTYQFHSLDLATSNLTIISWMMLRGVGMGLGMMPATTTAMNAVPRELIPRASALMNALQRIAGSFGTAIMATILTTRQTYQFAMASQTVTPLSPGFQILMAHARSMPAFAHVSAAVTQQLGFMMIYRTVAQTAAVRAIDDTFFVAAVICVPAILAALVMQNKKAQSGPGPRPILSE